MTDIKLFNLILIKTEYELTLVFLFSFFVCLFVPLHLGSK